MSARPTTHPALPEATAFADALARVVGNILAYLFHYNRRLGALYGPYHSRFSRASRRVANLMARLAKGTWRPAIPRAARPKPAGAEPRPKTPYTSRRFGWIGHVFDYQGRGFALQVAHILTTPEAQALFAAAPPEAMQSLGRATRDLCRLLGIEQPAPLKSNNPPPPPRVRKPRPPKPPKPRWRTPYLAPYPTTSPRPLRIGKTRQKFFA